MCARSFAKENSDLFVLQEPLTTCSVCYCHDRQIERSVQLLQCVWLLAMSNARVNRTAFLVNAKFNLQFQRCKTHLSYKLIQICEVDFNWKMFFFYLLHPKSNQITLTLTCRGALDFFGLEVQCSYNIYFMLCRQICAYMQKVCSCVCFLYLLKGNLFQPVAIDFFLFWRLKNWIIFCVIRITNQFICAYMLVCK